MVIYDKRPYQEVAVVARQIKPQYRDEVDVILRHSGFANQANPGLRGCLDEFSKELARIEFGSIYHFDGSNGDGYAGGMVPTGAWLITLISDTTGSNRAQIVDITSSGVVLDFRNK